ncbi:hypothetical protein A1O7_05021 [Cladophialophora yegresii CBS 114405]|uniref:Uncharacterized protein n=1 Tax=Cladophialophora yegresii CBS 114405 TaxID=1182544 RepID=W9VYY6_9EURO|nr:uncharacterized protein A1O7_05021 [Cladophialophora yegresii CBS 114405]EXJ60868.1 hypothetical protein A1O7_05021 [Cladophialophora yegresii CBS 114405]
MDENLLDVPNNTWVNATTAPGMGIPAWLYRRCLYLLDVESMPDSTNTRGRIQSDLLTQTGIRVPWPLMTAVTLTYMDTNPDRRNRFQNFTEAQMRPVEGDGQIQPVGPIRRDATTVAATARGADEAAQEDRDRLEVAHILLSMANQVPQAAPLTVSLEASEETGTTNQGSHSPNGSSERVSPPADDHVPAPVTGDHNANASRNQTQPEQGLLPASEQHASPPKETKDSDVQARLRGILRHINATETIGSLLEGEHVQDNDQYLSTVEQPLAPAPPARTDNEVTSADSGTQPEPRTDKGARRPASPAANVKVDGSEGRPVERTTRPRRTRAPRKPIPTVTSERVTRSTAAKRKREELEEANKTQTDGEESSRTDTDENQDPPATKRPRLILKINTATGKITKRSSDAQDSDKADGEDESHGKHEGSTSSPTQVQGPKDRPTPITPRRLILRPPKAPTKTKATGKSRKRQRSDEPQDEGDAGKESDDGKAKKRRTGK